MHIEDVFCPSSPILDAPAAEVDAFPVPDYTPEERRAILDEMAALLPRLHLEA